MKTTRAEQIKQHIDSFPVLPDTVMRLMKVIDDPECSVQDIMETIQSDQSLCLTILKIANSVLFGRPQKVESIKMAVVILGFNEVQRIAMAKALINSFNKLTRQHQSYIDGFWHHSFVCGIAARVIARDLKQSPDTAFMGGLIHDIGKLIMLDTFAADYEPNRWLAGLSDEKRLHEELQTFSFTHDMLGGQLLKKWLFPETLIAAVAFHHRPVGAVGEQKLAHIIRLADFLSFYCCNRELLKDDDILSALHTFLPEIHSQWQSGGLVLENEAIVGWFTWLLNNDEQGSQLKEAFSG